MTDEIQLRRALEQGELLLHYQPKVDLKTGQVTEVEALIRWQHPERGMLPPMHFIPLAEETGLIVPIGEWVLNTAATQNKAWQDQGLPSVRVAVNVSMLQFDQQGFARTVRDVLTETGLAPQHLVLEMTESSIMRSLEVGMKSIFELREIGVQLALDNFGTGYSSLAYLKRLPFDVLQIDRSFVRDLTTDADSGAVLAGMVAIAHGLRLSVVAEGVENEEQLDFVRRHGCDMVQGFLVSKPLPPDGLAEFLRRGPNGLGTVQGNNPL